MVVRMGLSAHPRLGAHPTSRAAARSIDMMVDTGATHTVVPEDVLLSLGLRSYGQTAVRTSMHQVTPQHAYRAIVSLELEDLGGHIHLAEFSFGVIGRPRPSTPARVPFEGLLGLDILRHFRLVYDGPSQSVELSSDSVPTLPATSRP